MITEPGAHALKVSLLCCTYDKQTVKKARQNEGCVIKFLHEEGNGPTDIHRRLVKVSKRSMQSKHSEDMGPPVRERRQACRYDKARSGRPHAATAPESDLTSR